MSKATDIRIWPRRHLHEVATVVKGKKPGRFADGASPVTVPYLEAAFLRGQSEPKSVCPKGTERLVLVDVMDTLVLWDGANAGEIFRGQTGVVASTMARVRARTPQVLPEFLYFCISMYSANLHKTAVGSTVPHVRGNVVDNLQIPLPPIPVQERIVQILQKTDEICRKRQEALELADSVLPAMYGEVFGEPQANPKGWHVENLGDYLTETRYGTSAKASEYQDGDPVLRIPNIVQRTIDTTDLKYLQASGKEREKLLLNKGDILVVRTNGSRDYVGRCAVFDLEGEFLFASYLIRLRVDFRHLNPHYVAAYLATSMGRQEISRNSRTSAGQYNISVEGLKAIRIPVPPIGHQQKFIDQYEQWKIAKTRLEVSMRETEDTLVSLIARAYSGKLTSEWEVTNAEWIAEQSSLYSRLPQLILLEFVSRHKDQAVPISSLMQQVFLLQAEGKSHTWLYSFVPSLYGPFSNEIRTDLDSLGEQGLVRGDEQDGDGLTVRIIDMDKVDEMLASLPQEFKEDIKVIVDTYGDLSHDALLDAVGEKYPAYKIKAV